jgi:parallel beta-helix repeat protein/predicted outer membrane repeat protein
MKKNRNHVETYFTCIFLMALILFPSISLGNTIRVPADQPNIQAAIDVASEGDRVLVADGIYSGERDKNLDFQGKAIVLESENGPGNCIIDCEGEGRGLYFHSGEGQNAIVSGFTIINGSNGGIFCRDSSSPTITNCNISGNATSGFGGGIYCLDSSPTITNCTISGNTAQLSGGGIYATCYIDYPNCFGPTITNCTISNNKAVFYYGGGISLTDGCSAKIMECIIQNNLANVAGGGIYCYQSSPIIANSNITGNTALSSGGGGICSTGVSSPTITNCTFNNNNAPGFNGGGGIWCNWYGSATLTNCILWTNSPDEILVTADSYPVVTYSDVRRGFSGEGNIDVDPLFVDPDIDNFRFREGSPCIDAGTNSVPDIPDTDFGGNARIVDGDGDGTPRADMGANEYFDPNKVQANFKAHLVTVIDLLRVDFIDQSSGSPQNWSWDFGDGETSTEQKPSHVYNTEGTYTVTLAVAGPTGEDTETKFDYIVLPPPAPTATFIGNPMTGAEPLTVQFTYQSSDSITDWFWDFGDGASSNSQRPCHTFTDAGDFTVSLTVTGDGGHNTKVKVGYIHVFPAAIIDRIRPRRSQPGDVIRIVGQNFGDEQGDSVVYINKKTFDSNSRNVRLWTDTIIKLKMPFTEKPCQWFKHGDGAYRKRKVWVTVGGVDSNRKTINVMKPDTCP